MPKWLKDWGLEKETKVNSDFLLMKSSKKCFILLPTFNLMKAPKNFEKNARLSFVKDINVFGKK